MNLSAYSFCEPSTAGPCAPWCIRRLTAAGRKLGGGVDTPSLCGRVTLIDVGGVGGWDLRVPVDVDQPWACRKCVAVLREEIGR